MLIANVAGQGCDTQLGSSITFSSRCVVGLVFSFVFGWRLSLVLVGTIPVLGLLQVCTGRVQAQRALVNLRASHHATGVADEILSLLTTVWAFGTYAREAARYVLLCTNNTNTSSFVSVSNTQVSRESCRSAADRTSICIHARHFIWASFLRVSEPSV